MRVVTGTYICAGGIHDSVVTIGNFDGVHRGHMELFRRMIAQAGRLGLQSVVVTFEPHPLRLLAPHAAPAMITTIDQKRALIESTGVDVMVVVPFTAEFAAMPADDFVHDVLCNSLGMRHIVIGHDYAFGRGRAGNFETLELIGAEQGFTVEYMEPFGLAGLVFSSSLARRLIVAGDMEAASRILGRYHMISGTVVHGREIGHAIGFPTANIDTANELLPPDGVYAVVVSAEGRTIEGACNIGQNPTFDGETHSIEVFLLDFNGRIYGQPIVVWFVQRLRDVRKFDGVPSLVAAINQDVLRTRDILATVDSGLLEPSVGKVLNEIEV